MKNFFKKVAFVLALAMVLSNIGPAAKVSAAETPGLKYLSRVLYVGESKWEEYTNSCWTPSQNHDGYKVTYAWDRKDIINVAPNGRITTTGNAIGKAVVTVTYTPIGSGKVETAKFTVKVRRNATDVRLTNATIEKVKNALSIGDEIELIAAKSWTTPVSYAKGNYGLDNYMGVVSDQIGYKVSDDSVIKVEDGKLKVVGAGTANLTVFTYEYGDKTQTPTCTKDYMINAIAGIVNVKQISITTLQVTFASELESVDMGDFTISQVDSSAVYDIKSVESTDKKVVTIETYLEMTDSLDFTLKHSEYEKSFSFKATSGKVADITINRSVIPYSVGTIISANLVDNDGIIIDTIKQTTTRTDVTFVVETNDGYMHDDKLYLYQINDKAKITITYTGSELDNEGKPLIDISKSFTITAANIDAISTLKATITNNDHCINWDTVSENNTIFAEEDGKYIHVLITNEDESDMTQEYGYYLESSNENVLIVTDTQAHNHTDDFDDDKAIYANIYGVKAGAANVIIRDVEGRAIRTILVNVKAPRKYASFEVLSSTVTVSNSMQLSFADEANVGVLFKDQYGDAFRLDADACPDFELVSSTSNGIGPVVSGVYDWWAYKYTFSAQGVTSGTYRYKITYEGVTRYVNVVVKEPTGNISYQLKLNNSNFDLKVNHNTNKDAEDGSNMLKVQVAEYKGGVLNRYLTDAEINFVTIAKGSKPITTNDDSTNSLTKLSIRTISGDVIYSSSTVSGSTFSIDKRKDDLGIGTYRVTVDIVGRTTPLTATFTITDSQPSLTATVDKTNANRANYLSLDELIKDILTFKYNGKTANDDAELYRMRVIGINDVTNGTKTTIRSVEIQYFVRDYNAHNLLDGRWVTFTVPVNKTFTFTGNYQ